VRDGEGQHVASVNAEPVGSVARGFVFGDQFLGLGHLGLGGLDDLHGFLSVNRSVRLTGDHLRTVTLGSQGLPQLEGH